MHSAGWQANAAFGDFHTVYSCDQYTFAALFDAHTATEVAEFCKRNCVHIFQECLEENAGDPRLALRGLFKELDASFFNSQAPTLVSGRSLSLFAGEAVQKGIFSISVAKLKGANVQAGHANSCPTACLRFVLDAWFAACLRFLERLQLTIGRLVRFKMGNWIFVPVSFL